MAALISRVATSTLARLPKFTPLLASARPYSTDKDLPYVDPREAKLVDKSVDMADLMGHATGKMRWELIQRARGNNDPFEMELRDIVGGTKKDPIVVTTCFDSRSIACICNEEAVELECMELDVGVPKRCKCGYWFKAIYNDEDVVEFDALC